MLTATYTDPTTGWQQRVEVLATTTPGDPMSSDAWSRIRNTDGEEADVPITTLRDAR